MDGKTAFLNEPLSEDIDMKQIHGMPHQCYGMYASKLNTQQITWLKASSTELEPWYMKAFRKCGTSYQ